jgi:hypothetical protein
VAIIVAGTEASIYRTAGHLKDAGSVSEISRTATATRISTNYSRHGMAGAGANNQGKICCQFPAQTDFWVHFVVCYETVSNTGTTPWFFLIDSTTKQICMQWDPDSGTGDYNNGEADWDWEYWDGAAFQELTRRGGDPNAHSWRHSVALMFVVDLHYKIDNSGTIDVYMDGVLRGTFAGDTLVTGVTGVDTILWQNPSTLGSATAAWVTELIVATEDTRGMRVATLSPAGNSGTNTAWTGAYTNWDKDSPTLNDTDACYSGTANQVETSTMSDLSAVADNLQPIAVVTAVRARVAASGPQNLQHCIRQNSVNYFSSNVTYLDGDALADAQPFGPTVVVWDTDPDTSAAWTVAGVNSIEVGVKSIA